MPMHDWTRVSAGTFHHFHSGWITQISDALNDGLLPSDYYAMAEQVAGDIGPDVITLQTSDGPEETSGEESQGGTAVQVCPPKVRYAAEFEMDEYVLKQKDLVIHHSSDDRIVAMIEILSPGNKSNKRNLRSFLDKSLAALTKGIHLLLVDLQPPTKRDPQGIHGLIWGELNDTPYNAPPDKPLTLAAYSAGRPKKAYVEPIAVGDVLTDMPLFLAPRHYVAVPLEVTYQAAWRGVPRRWRTVLEPTT